MTYVLRYHPLTANSFRPLSPVTKKHFHFTFFFKSSRRPAILYKQNYVREWHKTKWRAAWLNPWISPKISSKRELCSIFHVHVNWLWEFEMKWRPCICTPRTVWTIVVEALLEVRYSPPLPTTHTHVNRTSMTLKLVVILHWQWAPFNQCPLSSSLSPERQSHYRNTCWVRRPLLEHRCEDVRCEVDASVPRGDAIQTGTGTNVSTKRYASVIRVFYDTIKLHGVRPHTA
jgi:hypothetical protein